MQLLGYTFKLCQYPVFIELNMGVLQFGAHCSAQIYLSACFHIASMEDSACRVQKTIFALPRPT